MRYNYNVLLGLFTPGKKNQNENPPTHSRKSSSFAAFLVAVLISIFGISKTAAQTTYYSKAAATDFTAVASWGTALDGTGTSPATISNADDFIIANGAAMNLLANAAVRQLSITLGTLNVAGNTLDVAKATGNDAIFSIASGATLNVTGGNVNVMGQFAMVSGAIFKQSNGTIKVDGNNAGVAAGSIAGNIVVLYGTPTTLQLTGGTLIITDPSYTTSYALYGNCSTATNIGTAHTIQFGDGVSTDAGGTNGFYMYLFPGSSYLILGNVIANGGTGTNRFVNTNSNIGILGNLTVNANSEYRIASTNYLSGNLINNGTLTTTSTLIFGSFANATSAAATNAQTVSGSGVFRNLTAAPTASFASLTINNSSAGGVTLPGTTNIATQPSNSASVSGTLNFTNGKLSTSGGASVVLGISTPSAGTLSYTAGGFTSGTIFGRWFTATGTGSSFTASADATTATSRYPFVDSFGQARSAWIERVTPAAAAGVLAITYTNVPNFVTISATDGATPVDRKANDSWAVSSLSGTPLAAASFKLQMVAPGIFGGTLLNPTTRVIKTDDTFVGTHEGGTVTPGGHRIALTGVQLTSGSYTLATNNVDLGMASIASGDWNVPSTWNKGTVPTCTDAVTIAAGNTVTVNSAGNISKNVTINLGGVLVNASGDLTVGCTLNNNVLTNNGTLTVSGGLLSINGNLMNNAGSVFNQSAGNIIVDGSDGTAPNSVLTGTPIVRVTANAPGNLNWTGGILTIVDPHYGASTSDYALSISQGSAANAANPNHTVKFGNGLSTTNGGHANGFYIYLFPGSFYYSLGNVTVDALTGTNRLVKGTSTIGILGNLTVTSGEYQIASTNIIAGNVVNNGTITATALMAMGTFVPTASISASANAQSISGTGVFQNLSAASTANLTNFQVFNSNVSGVTLNVSLSVSGTLTLNSGIINTSNANLLTLGTTAAAGTLTGGSSTAYINGPFARTIATANANTNYIHFPVGKTVYAPIWLAPATTAVSKMKAETFDTNTGTIDASLINLATTRRWEAPLVSGTLTDINVRVGDAGVVNTSIPVQAPSASGIYTNTFGSVATYAAGTPPTTQSNTVATSANYTGFLSYANSNSCSGTPAPGNTIASANNLCLGTSVTLSLQNITSGSGVTYKWQSSPDGVGYTDIVGATGVTYTSVPAAVTYYQCVVTCATGPASGTSTPIQVTFSNQVTGTTPGSVCGQGTVNLVATASVGATVNWYDAASSGNLVGSGPSFTTPSLTVTTPYYASAETAAAGALSIGAGLSSSSTAPAPFNGGYGSLKGQYLFTAAELRAAGFGAGNITNLALDFTSVGGPFLNFEMSIGTTTLNSFASANIQGGLTTVYTNASFTPIIGVNNFAFGTGTGSPTFNWNGTSNIIVSICWTFGPTAASGPSAIVKTDIVPGGLNKSQSYRKDNEGSPCGFTGSTGAGTSTFNLSAERPRMTFTGQVVCSSPRIAVSATVTTPPTFTLSGNPASICAGQSSSAVTITAGSSDYDTYVWSPATGVSGNAITGWVFNPTSTTTYTLNASQSSGSLCVNSAAVTVTVNPLPSVMTISPSPAPVCVGSVQSLSVTGGTITSAGSGTIGTATTLTALTSQPTAFCNRYDHYWSQMVFTGAELTAAGMQAGNINSIKFNITSLGSGTSVSDFKVYMANTASTTLSGFTSIGLTQVFSVATYTHNIGINTIVFNTPFVWDGTSNVIVDVRQTGADSTNNAETYYTATPDNKTVYAVTSTTFATSDAFAASNPTATTSLNRLNTTFDWSNSAPQTITWSPLTDLYSDAAATIAYTSTNASTVYFKSNTAGGPTTYTATATTANSCTRTATVDVTVIATAAPTGSTTQTFCNASTVANLSATGTAVQWYANAIGGTALASTDALVDGVHYYASQTVSGCESATRLDVTVTVTVTAAPTGSTTQTFCNAATVANLSATGTAIQWYAAAIGGTALASTDALVDGVHYYASQTVSGCESATRLDVTVTVTVTAAPTGSTTQTFCNAATVANLSATGTGIQWYANAIGGTALASTDALVDGVHYYASQTLSGCESATRLDVTVTVTVTAAPTGSATQTFCNAATVANLSATGAAIQWYASAIGGTALASTDALVDGVHYYATQTVSGCESATRLDVTVSVNVTTVPTGSATQTFCNAATVADLTATGTGIQWYTVAIGGAALVSTTALVNGASYFASQTVSGCESATRFEVAVTVNNTPAPTGAAAQTFVTGQMVSDIVVSGSNIIWYASSADATNAVNPIPTTTVLVNNATYYATQTVSGCVSTTSLAVTVTVNLKVDSFDSNSFSYYPNPVNDILNLSYSQEITDVKVFNVIGQQVFTKNINATTAQIDMSGFANGAYFIKVSSDKGTKTVKVIKK